MTTVTVTDQHGISAITSGGWGVTLPAGTYELIRLVGSDPLLAYVYDEKADREVCIGRNDPGATFNFA